MRDLPTKNALETSGLVGVAIDVAASLRFIVLFLPVLVIALIVTWLPRAHPVHADPVAEEAEKIVRDEPPTPAQKELDTELSKLGAEFGGHVGIAVHDIANDRTVHFNGLELFPQQSVSKLWVSMTALDEADQGKLELSEPVDIRPKNLTLFHQPISDIVKTRGHFRTDYADLMERALTHSDNTANDTILRRVGGPEAVEDFLSDNHLGSIRFGTDERTKQSAIAGLTWQQSYSKGSAFFDARDKVPEDVRRDAFESYLADPMDGAAPVAVAVALGRLVNGDLLSSPSTQLLLSTLERTHSGPQRLKGGVPAGWTIAHKTGTGQFFDGEQSGYNDIGVVTSPDGNAYSVAVMIGRTRRPTLQRMKMMQEVVRAIVRYDAAAYSETEKDLKKT